jgi:hypothetical protein
VTTEGDGSDVDSGSTVLRQEDSRQKRDRRKSLSTQNAHLGYRREAMNGRVLAQRTIEKISK